MAEKPCPRCDGSKEYIVNEVFVPCAICGGTGTIDDDIFVESEDNQYVEPDYGNVLSNGLW